MLPSESAFDVAIGGITSLFLRWSLPSDSGSRRWGIAVAFLSKGRSVEKRRDLSERAAFPLRAVELAVRVRMADSDPDDETAALRLREQLVERVTEADRPGHDARPQPLLVGEQTDVLDQKAAVEAGVFDGQLLVDGEQQQARSAVDVREPGPHGRLRRGPRCGTAIGHALLDVIGPLSALGHPDVRDGRGFGREPRREHRLDPRKRAPLHHEDVPTLRVGPRGGPAGLVEDLADDVDRDVVGQEGTDTPAIADGFGDFHVRLLLEGLTFFLSGYPAVGTHWEEPRRRRAQFAGDKGDDASNW